MRVLSAKSRERCDVDQRVLTIGVLEVEQFGALSDVGTSIPGSMPVGMSRPSAKTVV